MAIGSLSQQRLESSDSVPLHWLPFMCLERNSPAELWAPFLYLCGPHRPCSGTWGGGGGLGEVPSTLCGWLMASWTRQFPSKPRGWLVLAVQILRIKNKLKTDRKCRSGCPSRPRWGKMCRAWPERIQPCGQTATRACPALTHSGLAAYSSESRAEPPLRIWHSDTIFQLDQSAQISVLLASLSFYLFFYFSPNVQKSKGMGVLWECPQRGQLFYFQRNNSCFLKQDRFYLNYTPLPSSLHFCGIP